MKPILSLAWAPDEKKERTPLLAARVPLLLNILVHWREAGDGMAMVGTR